MKTLGVIVFDMDGVLADVRESYLAAIAETAHRFTGNKPGLDTIRRYKESGGWNNDWELAFELIRQGGNAKASYSEVVESFQEIFRGRDFDGLILRERWIPEPNLLERLNNHYELAVLSGRPRDEIEFTLKRFVPAVRWNTLVGEEDVTNQKPDPEGLEKIAQGRPRTDLTYVGDSIDDARCARAAGVPFIGIMAHSSNGFIGALRAEGAKDVIEDVNELERVLL